MKQTISKSELLKGKPAEVPVTAAQVLEFRAEGSRQLIVLDDDPTGTQSVGNLPVLTRWTAQDLTWALETRAPAIYVMTNSRSLGEDEARERNLEVAINSIAAANRLGVGVDFVSRSDSTLRGHYPLEPRTLEAVMAEAGIGIDGVVIVPAFGDAGRITVDGIHYTGSDETGYLPVGHSEFANDATFGYEASGLREWVVEKTGGDLTVDDVAAIDLHTLRSDSNVVDALLNSLTGGQPVVVDIVTETDLRLLAIALSKAEHAGKRFIYRVGPPFVRALIGQPELSPLTIQDVGQIREGGIGESAAHGLVVVGSHVGLTTRQLDRLRERVTPREVEIDVPQVLNVGGQAHLQEVIEEVVQGLQQENIVIRTSRVLVTGDDADSSLDIARRVSDAVVTVVKGVLARTSLRFVVAKGGITSSDVANKGLDISRAVVRGPMLPGIVSLWEPMDGPAKGIPYIVFAGNVGDEESLADVVGILTSDSNKDLGVEK